MKQFAWIALLFLLLAPLACNQKFKKVSANEITGTVTVSQELMDKVEENNAVFIIAKDDFGPPVAVKRLQNVTFPLEFNLTEADAMTPGNSLQGPVKVSVRIDKDGSANPLSPGDLWGEIENVYPGKSVAVVIDKEFSR